MQYKNEEDKCFKNVADSVYLQDARDVRWGECPMHHTDKCMFVAVY